MTDSEIAPCLVNGPLAEHASKLVEAASDLGDSAFASGLRARCVPTLFLAMEQLLVDREDPIRGVNTALDDLSQFLRNANETGFDKIVADDHSARNGNGSRNKDVKEITGEHYGNLFKQFSDRSFWDEPVRLLGQRLHRNGISNAEIRNRSVLDSGCGGGRYAVAWRLLGARPVVGVDISPMNIRDAAGRAKAADLEDIHFREGDVLSLPVGDAEFDIVFSNGVLHHTTDWKIGIKEIMRVLKPGGWGWLYLIEKPGGVFWDVIEILRVVMKNEDKGRTRTALQKIGMPANRIFYMLDHVMVPINLRLAPEEIEACLVSCGAVDIRRLERGADIDRIEYISCSEKFAIDRFGIGENRYVFSKP